MGSLIYGNGGNKAVFDDRTLAHMKTIIITKLRRQESFTLSWLPAESEDRGRISLWIHPSIPLQFEFDVAERIELNQKWLASMIVDANASGDIRVTSEPELAPV